MTAGNLLKDEITEGDGDDEADNIMVRLAKKYLKTSDHFDAISSSPSKTASAS